ncbi:GPI-linked NAD(P)(+)--arginine ADP-ribosyltransferase 1-like [Perca fluviatilis]|uniref:GPI-linked NAD(P)(+)--arginine ADP-ribosyltransferase 1-like n=1 Tax=Perca fluviatilis TaxID=8168 RepID=UPI001965EA8F|nr:GPI-linked NAD(P)(+)--arginine ADP-ribosyltransferase 1-like [Perca fluviatilis]
MFLLWLRRPWVSFLVFVVAMVIIFTIKEAGKSGAVAGAKTGENSVLPLDMAENSVDDMYDGCKEDMKKRVTKDLENEKNKDKNFKAVWDRSENTHTPFGEWFNKVLKRKLIVAIRTYTDETDVYSKFNAAVRTQGPEYKTTFGYHAFHFLLTTAIQDISASDKKQCFTVYRRVNEYFSQDVENTLIRFGSFTSASQGDYGNKDIFGEKSCFEILTCMGADISPYSTFPNEAEVLIPPYEVFKVVKIEKPTSKRPCEVVYTVKHTGAYSKLNCTLFPK